jgi:Arc/MetJ-type ribon-helix-helix transcriptional regulator
MRKSPTDSGPVTIELAKDVEAFLQEQVEAGVCASASELVNDTIRSLRERHRVPFKISRELEAWLLASAGKSTAPLTKRHIEAIRKRLRARTGSASS